MSQESETTKKEAADAAKATEEKSVASQVEAADKETAAQAAAKAAYDMAEAE